MLSVRNAVVAAAALFVLSILASVASMMREPNSGGMGNDSYGTRGHGYRALFELLDELDVPVTRHFSPPDATKLQAETIVFLRPNQMIVGTEPSYLSALLQWVNEGGRLIVAPENSDSFTTRIMRQQLETPPPDFMDAIGLENVSVSGGSPPPQQNRPRRSDERGRDAESVAEDILDALNGPLRPLQEVSINVKGDFPELNGLVQRLTIPAEYTGSLVCEDPPDGSVVTTAAGEEKVLAARFKRGSGEIIIVADPLLLTNRLLAKSDNSVFAAQTLAPAGQAIVFDEFYHGLGVRGQPLYLLTRLSFASVTIGILIALGLWTWRKAVIPGPPVPDEEVRRRDIREYVHAMANFFSQGGRGRKRLVGEVKQGVLRQLSIEHGLPPDCEDVDRVAASIARKDVSRSQLLLKTTQSIDEALQSRRHLSETETLDAMQRMSACL